MKGLLLKDWYMMTKYCLAYLLLVIIFTAVSFFGNDNLFLIFYPSLLCGMIPVNLLAYDESSRWTQYSEALPYTRAQIVSAKYLIGVFVQLAILLLTVGAQAIRMHINGGLNPRELLILAVTMIAISSLSSSFSLPFIFKLGVEKGRAAYYVMIGIACGGSIAASNALDAQTEIGFHIPLLILACVSLGVYALSWYLSIIFYKKREL